MYFFFAERRLVVTVTMTTTTIPKQPSKNSFGSGKKIDFLQYREQELYFFHGNLEQKRMDGPPFVISILINQNKFVNVFCDTGCLFYGIVDSKFITKCGLKGMKRID